MIQTALLPASAQQPLTIDPSGDAGGMAGAVSPFSALLEAQIGATIAGASGEPGTAPTPVPVKGDMVLPAKAKLSGKAGGKILPDIAQIAGRALRPATGSGANGLEADDVLTTSDSLAPAQVILAFATTLLAPDLPAPTAPVAALTPAKPAPVPGAVSEALATTPAARLAPGQKLLAKYMLPASQVEPTHRTSEAPKPGVAAHPFALPAAETAHSLRFAIKLPGSGAPAEMPTDLPLPVLSTGLAEANVTLTMRPAGKDRTPRFQPVPGLANSPAEGAPLVAVDAASTEEATQSPAAPQIARALHETALQIAPDLGAPPVAAPASAAPPADPASKPQDFAALIDRLVEARQAAETSLTPQTVNTAINHAEFGKVSLQFRADADGLSVAMASADPGLAKAVQVATPAASSGMAPGSDSSAAPQRQQESGEQQSASATPSQSQSQAQQRGQSGQRFADDARLAANPSPRRSGLDDKPERSGIFA